MNIAAYVPSERMHGILRVAANAFDVSLLALVADVALAQLADDMAMRAERDGSSGVDRYHYFLTAPESRTKVDTLIHVARVEWMRDPS